MSMVTTRQCDIRGCDRVTDVYTYSAITYVVITDQGRKMHLNTDVDLCSFHQLEYKNNLPELKFKEKIS